MIGEIKRKAVFLDRDGVLCEDTDYVSSFEKLHIFPYAKEAVDLLHNQGYLVIVISNQSGVARGFMTEEMVQRINEYIKEETGVDAVYYCPHLPMENKEILPYRVVCNCRKPNIGMIIEAVEKFNIDLGQSFMVGDRPSDIQTGKRAGVKTVWIESSHKAEGFDYSYFNILEFAKKV